MCQGGKGRFGMRKDSFRRDKPANSAPCHFGEHLTIDGYDGDPEKLNDRDLVLNCLNELPERLGMTKLSEPQVYFAPGNSGKDPGGWSGFIIVAESHISIHTFPLRRFISIDVYSCKNGMNISLIRDYFKEKFSLQEIETNFIRRGTKYPVCNIA
jgi:S-adenosylmethionine decarboxylase